MCRNNSRKSELSTWLNGRVLFLNKVASTAANSNNKALSQSGSFCMFNFKLQHFRKEQQTSRSIPLHSCFVYLSPEWQCRYNSRPLFKETQQGKNMKAYKDLQYLFINTPGTHYHVNEPYAGFCFTPPL